MRRSRMGGVEEVSLGAPGHQDDGLAAPGMYSGSPGVAFDPRRAQRQDQRFGGLGAGGNYAGPGVSFDPDTNLNGAAEPVMTLSGGGRVARRRSFGGQLRREARQYARRSQLAGLGDIWDTAVDVGGKVVSGYVSAKTGGAVDVKIDHNGASVGAGPIIPGVIDGQTVFTTKTGAKVQLSPEAVSQINTVQAALAQAQAGAAAAFSTCQGNVRAGICEATGKPVNAPVKLDLKSIINQRLSQGKVAPKKSSKVVPIVAGAAVIGLLIWAL